MLSASYLSPLCQVCAMTILEGEEILKLALMPIEGEEILKLALMPIEGEE